MHLNLRQRLQSTNRRVEHVYFVETGVLSVLAVGADRRQVEVALIGREGMTGCNLIYGIDKSPCDIVVQVAGQGFAIAAEDFRKLMATAAGFASCVNRFAHGLSIQILHGGLASAHGKIDERLARWLLMVHDRIDGDEMSITHETMALMLGVRRAGVTISIQQLEAVGAIRAARGLVCILDRPKLEACSKGLYGQPELELARLFPPVPDRPPLPS